MKLLRRLRIFFKKPIIMKLVELAPILAKRENGVAFGKMVALAAKEEFINKRSIFRAKNYKDPMQRIQIGLIDINKCENPIIADYTNQIIKLLAYNHYKRNNILVDIQIKDYKEVKDKMFTLARSIEGSKEKAEIDKVVTPNAALTSFWS